MNTDNQPMYKWKSLPWQQIERQVFKLQKRIYQASQRGETRAVHKLQRLLIHSWSARCLAVRRVTQDNRGKRTAGVDGKTALTGTERMELVEHLSVTLKSSPLRRVWIEKQGTDEKRPLGIPTIADRAMQALVKLGLEPEWEAHFEPNSYGFRPGRGCHDAIEAIFNKVHYIPKYVLDADITKCFDRINHEVLLQKLNTFPVLRRLIKGWLKAGIMEGKRLFPTDQGTPQGGVISPLLANIALHGFETAIMRAFPTTVKRDGKKIDNWRPRIIRYADDFVIIHRELDVIKEAKRRAEKWLSEIGLELNQKKTQITHTLHEYEGRVGFDFLGFTIRQFPVGKTHYRMAGNCGLILDFKTIITPSKKSILKHYRQIAEIIAVHKSSPQVALISRLNPIIRGWCNYYAPAVSTRIFSKLDHLITRRLLRWIRRRHPKKSRKRIVAKYWQMEHPKRRWIFRCKATHISLLQHTDTHIRRHIKVKGTRSPFDGDWAYWATRMGKHPMLPGHTAKLLKRQKGRCAHCGLYIKYDDIIEVDHIIPRSEGGRDKYSNLQLLHGHCHDVKSSQDRKVSMTRTKYTEEPCEAKVSSTVLQTSRMGDHPA
jgi:RNA-directed DNA polymerase